MSQQMEQNEYTSQQQVGYNEGYQGGYHDPFAASPTGGQKLSAQGSVGRNTLSSQRTGLAIVSVIMISIVAISLLTSASGVLAMLIDLAVVFVVALALVLINWVFNRR